MCGFIGTYALDGRRKPIPVTALEQHLIESRGPDESAEFGGSRGFVRFHRLRLVGTDRTLESFNYPGPIHYALINGTLHNHCALVPDAATDHEALAELFLHSGEACWDRLEGGFAACIEHHGGLTLATDAIGEKSLCWAMERNVLWYSTSPLLLAFHLRRQPRSGKAVFTHVAFRGQPVGETYFTGIRQLPPGHQLTADSAGIRVVRWPSKHLVQHLGRGPCATTRDLFEALATKMKDGVPGLALSGGVDSSTLAVVGYHHAGLRTACSVAGEGDPALALDLDHARRVTQRLPEITHHLATPGNDLDLLAPRDFPILDQDEQGLDAVARTLRAAGCNLLVGGDGADELFCGYDRIYRFAAGLDREEDTPGLGLERLVARYAYVELAQLEGLTSSWRRQLLTVARNGMAPETGNFRRTRRWFVGHHLFWLLRKLDFVAGRYGMDGRTPFLHRRIVASALRLGPAQLLPDPQLSPAEPAFHRQVKRALKAYLGHLLPNQILERIKQPFPVNSASAARLYLNALPAEPNAALPPALHMELIEGKGGNTARLHYLSYLTWEQSCLNHLT